MVMGGPSLGIWTLVALFNSSIMLALVMESDATLNACPPVGSIASVQKALISSMIPLPVPGGPTNMTYRLGYVRFPPTALAHTRLPHAPAINDIPAHSRWISVVLAVSVKVNHSDTRSDQYPFPCIGKPPT